jgi:CspA family cold shock protein
MRERGTIKWANAAKGYGFIERPSGDDLYVNAASVKTRNHSFFEHENAVEFEVVRGPKGLTAEDVFFYALSVENTSMSIIPDARNAARSFCDTHDAVLSRLRSSAS